MALQIPRTQSFKLPGYNWRRGKTSWDKHTWLYISVIIAVVLGAAIGLIWPEVGIALEPIGKGFVALIKMMIAPVIFCTIVLGIGSVAQGRDRRQGRRSRAAATSWSCRPSRWRSAWSSATSSTRARA